MSTQLESLRTFVAGRGPAAPADPSHQVVVVAGGKGGVGTSTLAALLAVVISSTGERVLLVEATAQMGTLHLLLGTEAGNGWGSLRRESTPEEITIAVTDTLALVPGTSAEEYSAIGAPERQALLRRIASLYGSYDLVVVDAGCRIDSVTAACAAGAGSVLAISTPDRVSVAATYALVKVLDARHPGLPIQVLINRDDEGNARSAMADLQAGALRFLDRTVEHAGTVPEDRCLRAGIDAGLNLQDVAAGSEGAAVIYQVGRELIRTVSAGYATARDPLNLHRRS